MTFEKLKQKAVAEWDAFIHSKNPIIYIETPVNRIDVRPLRKQIETDLKANNIDAQVLNTGCLGWCEVEPLIGIAGPNQPLVWYGNVTPEKMTKIISDCLVDQKPVSEGALFCMQDADIDGIPAFSHLPMVKAQKQIALRNCGRIDSENIHHYIAGGGYSGLAKALTMSPEAVIESVKKSGLRGRGGAGFSTAQKWQSCHDAPQKQKYVICNAAEGDPHVFKDRALLEGDPHAVLEGILICGYAVGGVNGLICINETYGTAIARIEMALSQMKDLGLLGNQILGTDFNFEIEIRTVAAGLVNGEETALINTLEDKRTTAYKRPPYPAEAGLFGKPTCVNNVETLAHVPVIMEKGPDAHVVTNLFTLSGDVVRSGLIEVAADTTLREMIYDMAGGLKHEKKLKAVRVGGHTGGWLIEEQLDMTPDYESLVKAGTIMGSGAIHVAGTDACAVALARQSLDFVETETCGKCVFGREGTMQLAEILRDIAEGRGRPTDIELLLDIGHAMKEGAFCGLCRSSPNPVLTTIEHFRDEYEAHVKGHKCLLGVCSNKHAGPA